MLMLVADDDDDDDEIILHISTLKFACYHDDDSSGYVLAYLWK